MPRDRVWFLSGLALNRPFMHSIEQWHGAKIEVRVGENTRTYENVHPNLVLVLLFICTEMECGKGLWGVVFGTVTLG